eukprot:TRINITY_DN34721_c0_g1_i1.p1 TRINITY_DN34721_c0_g1~~TRINITY_DN34721_c0_g1_i1.p1  ORF type:complete len:610 (-),score=110.37 TRINITY_DN34721_c0_g1_i1:102-1931(-)
MMQSQDWLRCSRANLLVFHFSVFYLPFVLSRRAQGPIIALEDSADNRTEAHDHPIPSHLQEMQIKLPTNDHDSQHEFHDIDHSSHLENVKEDRRDAGDLHGGDQSHQNQSAGTQAISIALHNSTQEIMVDDIDGVETTHQHGFDEAAVGSFVSASFADVSRSERKCNEPTRACERCTEDESAKLLCESILEEIRARYAVPRPSDLMSAVGLDASLKLRDGNKSVVTRDKEYFLEEISSKEANKLVGILPAYYFYQVAHPKTSLLVGIFAIIKSRDGKKVWLLRENLFPLNTGKIFVLKGTIADQSVVKDEGGKLLNDVNWKNLKMSFQVSTSAQKDLTKSIIDDSTFLKEQHLKDYALSYQEATVQTTRCSKSECSAPICDVVLGCVELGGDGELAKMRHILCKKGTQRAATCKNALILRGDMKTGPVHFASTCFGIVDFWHEPPSGIFRSVGRFFRRLSHFRVRSIKPDEYQERFEKKMNSSFPQDISGSVDLDPRILDEACSNRAAQDGDGKHLAVKSSDLVKQTIDGNSPEEASWISRALIGLGGTVFFLLGAGLIWFLCIKKSPESPAEAMLMKREEQQQEMPQQTQQHQQGDPQSTATPPASQQ